MAFVFYDTETTGTETRYDQILQFAAIRTDESLNEIERFEIRSRLNAHILANPMAMNVTGVSADTLHDQTLPSHLEMCQQIQAKLLSWSPATMVGYNSIAFDEEILRSAFYQSLLPIYVTNTGGNSRFDILKLVRAVHRYQPDALNWPTNGKGRISFRLDQLAPANGFNHANAHDALADVEATIFIAKLVRQRAAQIWDYLFECRTKKRATDLLLATPVATVAAFDRGAGKSAIVTGLGVNPDHDGQVIAFDLSHDPAELENYTDAELVTDKENPLIVVRVNASPVILPLDVAGPQCPGFDLGREELVRRAQMIREDPSLPVRLINAWQDSLEPYPAGEEVEEQIFDGFFSSEDQKRIDEFHKAPWDQRLSICNAFEDQRLKKLAMRLIYNEASEVLPPETRESWDRAIAERLSVQKDEKQVRWTTFEKALSQCARLLEEDPDNQLIKAHLNDLRTRQATAEAILSTDQVLS
jgi:exodeoxyribonuclease-1